MDKVINRFVWFLRQRDVRISPAETIDALRALGELRISDRESVKAALAGTLIKHERDLAAFEEVFETFFRLGDLFGHDHDHGHHHHHGDDRSAQVEKIKISEEPSETDDPSHSHDKPADISDLFDPEDLAVSYSIHKEAGKTDLSALSQELILNENQDALSQALDKMFTQINVRRLKNPGMPGDLASGDPAAMLDADLSVGAIDQFQQAVDELELDEELVEKLRQQVDGMIDRLPELLRKYLEKLMAQNREMHVHADEMVPAYRTVFTEAERQQMEELLRRLGRKINGALSSRRSATHKGRINIGRTMRSNLKYGGMPFKPVFHSRKVDKPRLVVLADVSLSVRNTSRFALHLVHNLQSLFSNVRTFAFVADLVEVTEYFEHSGLEEVLGMIFGGEILDVDANSNYGLALEHFYENYMTAVNGRTTVLVLGDGRGNGNPANAWVLEEVSRRAQQTIWFTPEQRAYWSMGGGDMPTYAQVCDRVEVVRSLDQLDEVVDGMVAGALATK
ncbi:VWA domain-containing protein [Rubrobacter marinus]|uniref:VWA domain-containing protein n=1 Tax=Rubrobacter marinus TaxID=2653852 RepID=A0A6G8Q1W9_9ACTN|nr:VWA domain-containing protein [Rubrobacter marinus]QIN80484.1 VWA domain-containing protein [Rubrobacter marinus]